MRSRRFSQVDVFTDAAFGGNPLAVVVDAEGVTEEEMLRFAAWMNLSETTFLFPATDPAADYRARIFTTTRELTFAGHPTLGSAHAWLEAGGTPKEPRGLVQECGAGLVEVRREEVGLAFAAPPLIRGGPVEPPVVAHVAGLLGLRVDEIVDAQWADNGAGWVAALLESAQAVLAVRPGPVDMNIGVVGPYPEGSPEQFEVRAFSPGSAGLIEDPVTGSLNAALAGWLSRTGRATLPYVARQGTVLGRYGRVHLSGDEDGTIWTGGRTTTRVRGHVDF